MRPRSIAFAIRRPGAPLLGAALLAAALPPAPALAGIESLLAEPTPLVLKDGRIASVAVQAIPFAAGADTLDAAAAAALDAFLAPLATDCFLSAQAIGHVVPGADHDGDTLSAHRLARARADHVQAALTRTGMAEPAIASVWDWQFLVEDSRVTLWIFSLTNGDDCEGTPLATAAARDVAPDSTAAPTVPALAEPVQPPAILATDELAAVGLGTDAAAVEAPADAPADLEEPEEPVRLWGEEPDAAEPAAAEPAEPEPDIADAENGFEPARLAIAFDINSSYFPDGASQALRRFIEELPKDAPIALVLTGAVGTSDVRGANAEEARRYNAWIAERRIERVAEWLAANAAGRDLALSGRFAHGDSSREVRIEARPGT